MRRPQKPGTRTRHYSLVTGGGAFRRKFRQYRSLYVRLAYKDIRLRSFPERIGPRIIFLEASQVSSCSKRSREIITKPIAVLTKIGNHRLLVASAVIN